MNESLFRWINGWPEGLDPVMVFFSEATKQTAGRVLFLFLAVVFLFASSKTRKALILGIAAVVLANEMTDVLKATFQVPRPCVELEGVRTPTGVLTSWGTASAHSANMAALATVLILVLGKWGVLWLPVALLTGLSRIYVGVHYPSQVLLGWTCGIVAGLVVVKTWEAWVNRRKGETVPEDPPGEHPAGAS